MKNNRVWIGLASILSVSVADASVTVVENGDFKWDIAGDVQVQSRQKSGVDEDRFVDYDDAELKNRVTYSLGNDMSAFAQFDYDFKKEQSEETYVGLGFGSMNVILGDTDLPSDDFGHEREYEGSSFEDAFDATATSSDDQFRLEYHFSKGTFLISTDVDSGDEDHATIDAFLEMEFGKFGVQLAYQDYQADEESESIDTVGIAFGLDLGPVAIGLDYSDNDVLEVLHLASGIKVAEKVKLGVGYEMATEEEVDIDSWYFNVTYKLAKNVSILAETHNDDTDDSDAGYVLGMRVKF